MFLTGDEDKRIVRLNLTAAAAELHIALEFRPIKDQRRLHVWFTTPEDKAAKPKRGGRPRKNAQEVSAEADGASEHVQDAANERPPVVQEQLAESPKKRTRRPRATASEAAS